MKERFHLHLVLVVTGLFVAAVASACGHSAPQAAAPEASSEPTVYRDAAPTCAPGKQPAVVEIVAGEFSKPDRIGWQCRPACPNDAVYFTVGDGQPRCLARCADGSEQRFHGHPVPDKYLGAETVEEYCQETAAPDEAHCSPSDEAARKEWRRHIKDNPSVKKCVAEWSGNREKTVGAEVKAEGKCGGCSKDCAATCGVKSPKDADGASACLQQCYQKQLDCKKTGCAGF